MLTIKQRHLVNVSSTTALGQINELKGYLESALNDAVTVNELKEVLIQLYAYCGFPRCLNGLGTLMAVLENRHTNGIQDEEGPTASAIPTDKTRFELGDEVQQELTGAKVKGPLFDFAPTIDAFLKEHLFADIFLRGVLSFQEREVVTIAALASLNVPSQLNSHLSIGMKTGLSQDQLNAIAEQLQSIEIETAATAIKQLLPNL